MKQHFAYAIILISTLLLFNCKKYDEDGKRSWHKPEKRIVGTWYLKEFLVNSTDSTYTWYDFKTSDVRDTIRWRLEDTRFIFSSSSNGQTLDYYTENIYIKNYLNILFGNMHSVNKWELKNKKNKIYLESTYKFYSGGIVTASFSIFGNISDDIWDIKKLTDKEMILETNNGDNKHLRLKLQK